MAKLPTDRTYIEATEAITWIAFGGCVNAAMFLEQLLRDLKERDRWEGWCPEGLMAYLRHIVGGAEFNAAKHGPVEDWLPRVEHLKVAHGTDERGLLAELRPYRRELAKKKVRLDDAEREFLEAARAGRIDLRGTPVHRGAKPDGAVNPEAIPIDYLSRKHLAITLSDNRLKFDWDADVGATRA